MRESEDGFICWNMQNIPQPCYSDRPTQDPTIGQVSPLLGTLPDGDGHHRGAEYEYNYNIIIEQSNYSFDAEVEAFKPLYSVYSSEE